MKKLLMIATMAVAISSCYNDKYDKLYPATPGVTCDTTSISYNTDIKPIIAASCAIPGGCHNADGNALTGNLDFTNLTTLQGQATTDLIVADINGAPTKGHTAMPLNLPKIAQCNINKITRWVNEGAPNN